MIFLQTMKLSHSIFLVATIILIIEILIAPANFVENPDNLVKSIFSNDVLDKISTLYLFLVVILFFFGSIVFFLEKGMKVNENIQSPNIMYDMEETDLNEEYLEDIKYITEESKKRLLKKHSTRSNPLM